MRSRAWNLVHGDAARRTYRSGSHPRGCLNASLSQNSRERICMNGVGANSKLRVFQSALKKSPAIAEHMLELWAPKLSPELLEQLCLQYVRSKGGGVKNSGFSRDVEAKLKEHGLLDEIKTQLEIAKFSDSLSALPEDKPILDIINEGAKESSLILQFKIEKNGFLSPELKDLESRWVSELQNFDRNKLKSIKAIDLQEVTDLPFKKQCEIVASVLTKYTARSVLSQAPIKGVNWLVRSIGDRLEAEVRSDEGGPWSLKTKVLLGSYWLECAIRACKFATNTRDKPVDENAFRSSLCVTKTSTRNAIVIHRKLKHSLTRHGLNHNYLAQVRRHQVPPLIPPHPWMSTRSSCMLSAARNMHLVSSESIEGEARLSEAIKTGAAFKQLRGVNRLQSQSWKINQNILRVLKDCVPPVTLCSSKLDRGSRLAQDRSSKKIIALAEALGDREFYLPMYMDFRGRCYASPRSLLNFMGNDGMRSLFLFGKATPLGPDGLQWLEIHLANMYGECKSQTFDARRRWVAQNRQNILRSVDSPWEHTWWKRGKRPFEALAACQELCRAWEHPISPAEYECALPIQLDGTSNGLQHLSALARSATNAPLINLAPTKDRSCGDVYQAIAQHVAPSLPRSVIKKALLTYFYGASMSSIAQLVLQETGPNVDGHQNDGTHPDRENIKSSSEIATDIATRISQLFKTEQRIQSWLVECARRLMNCRDPENLAGSAPTLMWTNPLGFPVVQPYTEPKFEAIKTALDTHFVPSSKHQPVVDPKRQIMGVVANFVHSLDAAHMLKTAQSMPSDLSFAAVHDSFWTHAGSVSRLNQVLRSQFIDLHAPNLLETVRQEWLVRYGNLVVQGTVHSDSPLYKDYLKNGESQPHESQNSDSHNGGPPLMIPKHQSSVKWKHGAPYLGSRYSPSVKAWFPLQLPHPPARGNLDISKVSESEYFFS